MGSETQPVDSSYAAIEASPQPTAQEVGIPDVTQNQSDQKTHPLVRTFQGAIIAAEVGPLNEALRAGIFTAAMVHSEGSPLAGALAYGGATLLVEGTAAVATAGLLGSDRGSSAVHKVTEKLNSSLPEGAKMNKLTEAGVALLGGSVVAMTAKQVENPTTTASDSRAYGLKTAGWLTGVCAVQGALMAHGIETMDPSWIGIGALSVGGVYAAARWARGRQSNEAISRELRAIAGETTEYDINKRHRFIAKRSTMGSEEAEDALEVERMRWRQYGYGDATTEYRYLDPQTKIYVARNHEKSLGVVRLFAQGPELPPFITEMDYDNKSQRDELIRLFEAGKIEELGTAARSEDAPKGAVTSAMWRLAYRAARREGIAKWGVIMEPERVKKLNDKYGFRFRQVGQTVDYQGGYCAAHIMDLQEAHDYMRWRKPLVFWWFAKRKLSH